MEIKARPKVHPARFEYEIGNGYVRLVNTPVSRKLSKQKSSFICEQKMARDRIIAHD